MKSRAGKSKKQSFKAKSSAVKALVKMAMKPGRAPVATRGFGGSYGSRPGELKFSDIAVATYQVNTTGSFTLLHIPILGSDFNARIGRKTQIKSLYLRGRLFWEAGSLNTNSQQARLMIVWDSQPNGAAPAVTDLLSSADPASHLNPNNRDRFRVICDKEYIMGPFNGATPAFGTPSGHNIKIYKKLNIESIFNATNGGTIADITSGALYMFWIGTLASGTNDLNAQVSTRVRYADA